MSIALADSGSIFELLAANKPATEKLRTVREDPELWLVFVVLYPELKNSKDTQEIVGIIKQISESHKPGLKARFMFVGVVVQSIFSANNNTRLALDRNSKGLELEVVDTTKYFQVRQLRKDKHHHESLAMSSVFVEIPHVHYWFLASLF